MKRTISLMVAAFAALSPALSFAEGGAADQDWAEKAALDYEEKAATAWVDGKAEAAIIYSKMARIKRDAAVAAKAGKEFSWDEYHALSDQLSALDKGAADKSKGKNREEKAGGDKPMDTGKKKTGEPASKPAKPDSKEKSWSSESHADKKEKSNPALDFVATAQKYQAKSMEALKSGDAETAAIYMDLARMKLDAATAVSEGLDYDWTEYHELLKSLVSRQP